MDTQAFARYLKQRGKAGHVVAELVAQVERWAAFLAQQYGKDVDAAGEHDVRAYAAQAGAGRAPIDVRGIALYYRFAGRNDLADAAAALREAAVAAKRSPFPLKGFPGIDAGVIARMRELGIANAEQMLAAGRTPQERAALAGRTGIAPAVISELVSLSDLTRLFGVKGTRARLYHDAGVDSVHKLAAYEPEELLRLAAEFVQRTGFNGIAPLPKEVESTIAEARRLPTRVIFEENEP